MRERVIPPVRFEPRGGSDHLRRNDQRPANDELGGAVRQPEHAEQAQAVCDEIARRARYDVDLLVDG